MSNLIAISLTFPTVVWTALLGVVLVYWLFVVVGAVHLGSSHADGAVDGAVDGIDADGVGDGAHADGADGVDGDGADGAHAAHHASILGSLKLRSVPITVVVSLIVVFAWLFSTTFMQFASAMPINRWLMGTLVLVLSCVFALPVTSLAIRPFARFFAHAKAQTHQDLVGKTCQVRTGLVDGRFGEATVVERGSDLVVRVRIDGQPLKRGQEAIITGWDAERDAFTVEPLDDVLGRKGNSRQM